MSAPLASPRRQFPSTSPIPSIEIDAVDPFERGRRRGALTGEAARGAVTGYRALFAAGGLDDGLLAENAATVIALLADRLPHQLRELEGVAEGSGIDLADLALLNARTEVLSQASGAAARECSTIVSLSGATASVQTWDWHIEFQDAWHRQRVTGTPYGLVGVTEFGILGKVGMNSAGLGLHLNILGHALDHVGGVPVHLLAYEILSRAGSVAEAVERVRSLPVTSSSTLTLVDPVDAAIVELSPVGIEVFAPQDALLLHTNHFLAPRLSEGEKHHLYEPDSSERMALLRRRTAEHPVHGSIDAIVPYLRSGPGEAALSVSPDDTLPFGQRWATLATIGFEPATRTMRVTRALPTTIDSSSWDEMIAP